MIRYFVFLAIATTCVVLTARASDANTRTIIYDGISPKSLRRLKRQTTFG